MAVVAGMVARLEAEISGFTSRMTAASAQIERVGRSGTVARRGVMLVNSSLQTLAFQAGGLPAPLGRAATGLLLLAGGGGPVLVAVAALGALALAFDRAGKKAQEMVQEAQRLRDFRVQHLRTLSQLGPGVSLTEGEQLAELQKLRSRTQTLIDSLTPQTESVVAQIGGIDPVAQAAAIQIAILTGELREFDRAIRAIQLGKINRVNDALRALSLARGLAIQARAAAAFPDLPAILRGAQAPPIVVPEIPIPMILRGLGGANLLAETAGTGAEDRMRRDVQMQQLALISSAFSTIGAVGAGGGFGAALAAGGGVLGAIKGVNPLIGAVVSGLGSVFSIFDKSEDRRHKELVEKLTEIEQNTERRAEPQAVTLTILLNGKEVSGAIAEEVFYNIRRLEAQDAVPRLPRGG